MNYKLVKLKWIDSIQSHGWVHKNDLKELKMEIISVGYLIKEDKDFMVITSSISEESFCAPLQIPKIAITYFMELENDDSA